MASVRDGMSAGLPTRKQMFTEHDLLVRARGMNLNNRHPAVTPSAKRPESTVYDAARKQRLECDYFGKPKERENTLLKHTRSAKEARFMQTCSSVSSNIEHLHRLGDRNWNVADLKVGQKLGHAYSKPQTAVPGTRDGFGLKGTRSAAEGFVRVYSPQESCYVERPSLVENQSQRLTYLTIKASTNANSFQISGEKCIGVVGKPFEKAVGGSKPYTTSAETMHNGWLPQTRPQTTSNYESSRFNIISHGYGQSTSITQMLKANPRACHKVKSISEYSDLGRVSSSQPNHEYRRQLLVTPKCFSKAAGMCGGQFDLARTYGPFFRPFK